MNFKYIELSRPYNPRMEQDFVEYNHVVDEILQISPPYTNESKHAPKYSAPEIKPGGEIPGILNSRQMQPIGIDKLLLKPEPSRNELMPMRDFSAGSFSYYPNYAQDRSGSMDLKNIGINKSAAKGGISGIINSLKDLYDMDENAPQQPSMSALDSLFQNIKSNNNSRILHQDISKNKSNVELKNQTYNFIQERLSNKPGGLVKINLNELPRENDDYQVFDQEPSFERSGANIIKSSSMIPLFEGSSNKPMKKD